VDELGGECDIFGEQEKCVQEFVRETWKKEAPVKALQFRTHSSTYNTAYTDACKTHYTVPVNTTVFLKMNPRVRNMYKTSKIKN